MSQARDVLRARASLIAEVKGVPYEVMCPPTGECICKEMKENNLFGFIVLGVMFLAGGLLLITSALPALSGNVEAVEVGGIVAGLLFATFSAAGAYLLFKRTEFLYFDKVEAYENQGNGEFVLLFTSSKGRTHIVWLRTPKIGGLLGKSIEVLSKSSTGMAGTKIQVARCGPYILIKLFKLQKMSSPSHGRRKGAHITIGGSGRYNYELRVMMALESDDAQKFLDVVSKAKEEIYFVKDPSLTDIVIKL